MLHRWVCRSQKTDLPYFMYVKPRIPANVFPVAGFLPVVDNNCRSRRLIATRRAGLTLVELVVTLAVLTVAMSIGLPFADGVISNNRVAKQTNDFVSTLVLARSEAIKRRVPVSVCASADQATCADSTDWSTGWIIFSDNSGADGELDGTDTLIHAYEALTGSSSFTSTVSAVRYRRNGSLDTAGGAAFTLAGAICSGKGKSVITVMPAGYPSLEKEACS